MPVRAPAPGQPASQRASPNALAVLGMLGLDFTSDKRASCMGIVVCYRVLKPLPFPLSSFLAGFPLVCLSSVCPSQQLTVSLLFFLPFSLSLSFSPTIVCLPASLPACLASQFNPTLPFQRSLRSIDAVLKCHPSRNGLEP